MLHLVTNIAHPSPFSSLPMAMLTRSHFCKLAMNMTPSYRSGRVRRLGGAWAEGILNRGTRESVGLNRKNLGLPSVMGLMYPAASLLCFISLMLTTRPVFCTKPSSGQRGNLSTARMLYSTSGFEAGFLARCLTLKRKKYLSPVKIFVIK